MIVNIRLSIDDTKFESVQYYIGALEKLAKPNYPGRIKIDFVGLKGTTKTKKSQQQQSRNPLQGASELLG